MVEAKRTEGNCGLLNAGISRLEKCGSFRYELLGMLEAMDAAYSVMKDHKDIMLIDLDSQGRRKMIPETK